MPRSASLKFHGLKHFVICPFAPAVVGFFAASLYAYKKPDITEFGTRSANSSSSIGHWYKYP
jgi:hypothetical protein